MFRKNNLFMFIFLFISMFIGISRVDAATGLYCIYTKDPVIVSSTSQNMMLVQDTSGNREVYYMPSTFKFLITNDNIRWDSLVWYKYPENAKIAVDSNKFDSDGNLLECPSAFEFSGSGVFNFDDCDKKMACLLKNKSDVITNDAITADSFISGIPASTTDYIVNESNYNFTNVDEKGKWIIDPDSEQTCLYTWKKSNTNGSEFYSSIQLNFYKSKRQVKIAAVDGGGGGGLGLHYHTKFVTEIYYSHFDNVYADNNGCPYFLFGASDSYKFAFSDFSHTDIVRSGNKYILTDSKPEIVNNNLVIVPNVVDNCEELLGNDLIAIFKGGVTLIKILIPLVLIVLGISDFTQATFGSKEDDMKKVSSRFIKRVIIAVVIFLIPNILEILLTLASNVWSNISPNLCGIL